MIRLSYDDVIVLASEVLEEKGANYIYGGSELSSGKCRYVRNGEPDCLVGNILHRAGVSVERLAEADFGMGLDASDLCRRLHAEGVLEIEDRGTRFLNYAQALQDNGVPWGDAVERAEEVY